MKKAKLSNDTQIARQMNMALAAEVGSEPENMEHVLDVLAESGFVLANLNPSTEGYFYVWEKKSNQIMLMDSDFNVYYNSARYDENNWTLWAAVSRGSAAEALQKADVAVNWYVAEAITADVSLNYVADFIVAEGMTFNGNVTMAGNNGADAIVQGSVNGTLCINNANAAVTHRGTVDKVDIIAVKGNSYHEEGCVKKAISIAEGRLVIEESAFVSSVSVVAAPAGAAKSVAIETNSVVSAPVVKVETPDASVTVTKSEDSAGVFVEGGNSGNVTAPEGSGKIEIASVADFMPYLDDTMQTLAGDYYFVLTGDVEVPGTIIIGEETNAVLDLNGHTLSAALKQAGRHYYVIDNYGKITINDFSSGETGAVRGRGIENFGVMTINGGTFYSVDQNGGAAVWNEADLTVNGGSFKTEYVGNPSDNSGPGCLNSSGRAFIYAGKFESVNRRTYSIISTGEIIITPAADEDVIVTGAHGALSSDGGMAAVYGGIYTSSDYYGLYVSNDGTGGVSEIAAVMVYGGVFTGKTYSVWIGSDVNESVNSTIKILGGTFNNPINAQLNTVGNVMIAEGGKFTEIEDRYIALGFKKVQKDGYFHIVKD